MKTRKPHAKSRRGCLACKARHVKCDEQGPPCAGCVMRETACAYPPPKANRVERSAAVKHASLSGGERVSPEDYAASTGGTSARSPQLLLFSPSPTSLTPSPSAFSAGRSNDRLLELELMHRWTSKTWAALSFIPGDQPFLQHELPNSALENPYVLDGVMALAAVDLAITSRRSQTFITNSDLRTAIQYSNRASAEFRHQLSHASRNNIQLLYYFSTMAALFNFAAPAVPVTPLQHTDMAISMILGAVSVAQTNYQQLSTGPSAIATVLQNYEVDLKLLDALDTSTRTATARMSSVIRAAHLPGGSLAVDNAIYRLATGQLKYSFAQGAEGLLQGNWITFLALVGQDFADAVRAREQVALFLLMYYAVLVHRASLASPEKAWWLGSMGRELVAEISDLLSNSPLVILNDVRDGIAWARLQTALPPIAEYSLSHFIQVE